MTANLQRGEEGERARLAWQCRRGMLELDWLLQDFLERDYGSLSNNERDAFNVLLAYPDQLLLEYLMGRMVPTDPTLAHVVRRIRGPAAS